jgi:hypothetical protein
MIIHVEFKTFISVCLSTNFFGFSIVLAVTVMPTIAGLCDLSQFYNNCVFQVLYI